MGTNQGGTNMGTAARSKIPFEYAVRNLGRAPGRSLLALAGSTLVVVLVIAAAGFTRGMNASLTVATGQQNIILLGAGSEESIERSEVPMRAAAIAAASLTGVRERLGERYVSPEIHVALAVAPADGVEGELTLVRGVRPVALLVHSEVQLVAGELPRAGHDEVMIGELVPAKLGLDRDAIAVDDMLWIDGRPWRVSGRFRAPRSVADAEVWMPLGDLQVVAQRDDLSCVVVTLDPERGGDFADVETFAATRLDLELAVLRERDYYAALTRFFAPIRWMVMVTAALIAFGAALGGLNTFYAAFASRTREVGTLQVFGYSRVAVGVSILEESLLAAATGALIACAIGRTLIDGIAVRLSMGAFGLMVDAPVLALGIGAGLVLGVVGALPAIVRCARMPIAVALKS